MSERGTTDSEVGGDLNGGESGGNVAGGGDSEGGDSSSGDGEEGAAIYRKPEASISRWLEAAIFGGRRLGTAIVGGRQTEEILL